jgi:tetratricopeptide (TPR) repeat protein
MSRRLKLIMTCMGLTIFLSISPINAQILQDTIALKLVREDIDFIYNLQFNNAREVYSKIIKLYPEHPIVFLLKGIMTYWENYPMLRTTPSHVTFEEDMRQCVRLSLTNSNPEYKAEYLLANLCASGMLLMYYDDNDLIMEVIPLAKSTYTHLRQAFDLTRVCSDLYYFTGLYDYYREGYPKVFPIYKSLLLPFPSGDMPKGLKELKTAATNSVVLRPQSYSLLSSIYMNFENDYPESLSYWQILHEQYPENIYYFMNYTKTLLLMKQYDEAEKLIVSSSETKENKFFQAQLLILKGILQEKKYHENSLAQQYYNKGISDISIFGKYGNEFAAYSFFGLSRIGESNGEKQASKIYRKEALRLASFKKINFDK